MLTNELFGSYITKTFNDIFPEYNTFKTEYDANKLKPKDFTKVETLYYLLYANYGNANIANTDENQFKYRLWSTIMMYGPTWEKRSEIQEKLRALEEADILAGSRAIYNHAFNDGSDPTTATLEEITYINEQNTTNYKKSKLEGYAMLIDLLSTNATKEFIDRFKPLFLKIVAPQKPLLYKDEVLEYEYN